MEHWIMITLSSVILGTYLLGLLFTFIGTWGHFDLFRISSQFMYLSVILWRPLCSFQTLNTPIDRANYWASFITSVCHLEDFQYFAGASWQNEPVIFCLLGSGSYNRQHVGKHSFNKRHGGNVQCLADSMQAPVGECGPCVRMKCQFACYCTNCMLRGWC